MLCVLYNSRSSHARSKSVSTVNYSPCSSPTKAERLKRGTLETVPTCSLFVQSASADTPTALSIAGRNSHGTRSITPLPSASPNPSTLAIDLAGFVRNGNEREDARTNIPRSMSVLAVVRTCTVLVPALERREQVPQTPYRVECLGARTRLF